MIAWLRRQLEGLDEKGGAMEPRIGDRLTDETGEWEVASRPYTSGGGKTASARVRRVGQRAGARMSGSR